MWAEGAPGTVALTQSGLILSFGELAARVGTLAARLRGSRGILAFRARNDISTAALLLAGLDLGRPVALLPEGSGEELAAMRALLGAAIEVDGDGATVWEARGAPAVHHPEAALIGFTSGSTGRPRAVQISRAHLERNTANVVAMVGMREIGEQILYAPVSHLFALLGHLLPGLKAGIATHLYSGVGEVRRLLAAGGARGIMSGVPSHWEALLRTTASEPRLGRAVERIVVSGSHFGEGLRRRLAESFPAAELINGYGLSEAPRILAISSRDPRFFSDVTGLPTPGAELDIGPGGELRVRGALLMLGYLGDPEGTAARISDGWFRTGDAARRSPDGAFTVLGRLDDVRKIGGERISLTEVDDALLLLPGVEDAAAATEPDPLYGERLVAFLVCEPGHGGPAGRQALRESLARRLSLAKVPSLFYAVAKLPRNRAGKIRRGELLKLRGRARPL